MRVICINKTAQVNTIGMEGVSWLNRKKDNYFICTIFATMLSIIGLVRHDNQVTDRFNSATENCERVSRVKSLMAVGKSMAVSVFVPW